MNHGYIERNANRTKIDASCLTGDVIACDFETYYDKDYSLTKLDYRTYCTHEKFDAYVVSFYDGKNSIVCHPMSFPWEVLKGKTIVSYNADFDSSVYEYGLGAPADFPFKEWVCAYAACKYNGINSNLQKAYKYLFNMYLSKDVRSNAKGVTFDGDNLPQDMIDYVLLDSIACYNIWTRVGHTWPRKERIMWGMSVNLGNRGVPISEIKLEAAIEHLAERVEYYDDLIPFEKMPTLKKIQQWCEANGIEPPATTSKTSAVFKSWFEEWGESVPWLVDVAKKRSANRTYQLLKTIKERLYLNKEYGCKFLAFNFNYFGSSTGRWTSTNGFNALNLSRDKVEGIDVRNLIEAPKGYKIIAMDLSAIEVRMTLWHAKAEGLLEDLREGKYEDFYEAFARRFGVHTGDRPLKDFPKIRHGVKGVVLGCGYGLGAKGYSVRYGIPLKEAETLVNMYRDGLPELCARPNGLWHTLTNQMEKPLRRGLTVTSYVLPSGRTLYYRGCDTATLLREDNTTYTVRNYGIGSLRKNLGMTTYMNNVIQAAANDLIKEVIFTYCKLGGSMDEIILVPHDEIVLLVKEEVAEERFKILEQAMLTLPDWAEGLPLACEGKILDRYEK